VARGRRRRPLGGCLPRGAPRPLLGRPAPPGSVPPRHASGLNLRAVASRLGGALHRCGWCLRGYDFVPQCAEHELPIKVVKERDSS